MEKKQDVQFCPKCMSLSITSAKPISMGNPFLEIGSYGWECLECGYNGKDFFIMSKEEHEKLKSKRKSIK